MTDTKSSTKSNLIFFGLLAAVLAIYLFVIRPSNRDSLGPIHHAIGTALPDFSLEPLEQGEQINSNRNFAGKVVLINFWATWCPPCMQEFPHMVAIEKTFRDHPDFLMLPIASAGRRTRRSMTLRVETKSFLDQRRVTMPVFVDPNGAAFVAIVTATHSQPAIPLTIVADRNGIIRGVWEGYRPGSETSIEALIQQLLDDKQAKKSPAA